MEGAGAYKQLTNQTDGLSQSLQFWGSKYGAERQAKEIRRENKADAYAKDSDAKTSEISLENSGNKSLDTVLFDYRTDVQQRFAKATRAAQDAILKGDRETAAKFQTEASTIYNNFKNTKEAIDQGSKIISDYIEATKNEGVNPLEDKYPMLVQDIVDNKYDLKLDAKGVTFMQFENGAKIYPQDLVKKGLGYSKAFNSLEETAKIGAKLGLSTWDEKSGRYLSTNTNLSDAGEERLKLEVDYIVNDDSKLSQVLHQLSGGKQTYYNNDFSMISDDMKEILKEEASEYLEKAIRGTLKTKESKKVDPLDASNRGWAALRNAKKAAEYKRRADKNKDTTTIQPMSQVDPEKGQGYTLGKKVSLDPNDEVVIETFYTKGNDIYIQPYSRTEKSAFPTDEKGFGTTGGNKYEKKEFRKATLEEKELIAIKLSNPEKETGGSFKDSAELYKFLGLEIPTKKQNTNKSEGDDPLGILQ